MIHIRTFIGIDFDEKCKNTMFDLQQRLRKYAVREDGSIGNFTSPSSFSVRSADRVMQVDASLKGSAAVSGLSLEISETGIFKGKTWCEFMARPQATNFASAFRRHRQVDVRTGLRRKKALTPHITIGQDIVFSACSIYRTR